MSNYYRPLQSPTARRAHKCIACFGPIAIDEVYRAQSGFFESRAFRNKFHAECFDALSSESEFEFSPGSLEMPERLQERRGE